MIWIGFGITILLGIIINEIINGKKGKRRKILIWIVSVTSIIVIVALIGWNRYLNKNNFLKKYETPNKQEVYMLGTLHEYHFNKWVNYSMDDILSAVENIEPDVIFIESREDVFKEYGVVDGPIDMSIVYSYAIEKNIPVEMIDWWKVDNDFKSNSTNGKRDDMIFENINNKLSERNNGEKVLIVCGRGHLFGQNERFLDNGYKSVRIDYVRSLFMSFGDFKYPEKINEVWEKRAYFYAYTYPKIIEQIPDLNDEVKSQFTGGNADGFYKEQMKYCDIFSGEELYK